MELDTIYNEDCLSGMAKLPNNSIDMILCDLPYGTTRNQWDSIIPPVDLFEYLIKTHTNEGEVVLDNCMGSGTTAIACLNTSRHYIGFELDKDYYNKALERIKNNATQLELF